MADRAQHSDGGGAPGGRGAGCRPAGRPPRRCGRSAWTGSNDVPATEPLQGRRDLDPRPPEPHRDPSACAGVKEHEFPGFSRHATDGLAKPIRVFGGSTHRPHRPLDQKRRSCDDGALSGREVKPSRPLAASITTCSSDSSAWGAVREILGSPSMTTICSSARAALARSTDPASRLIRVFENDHPPGVLQPAEPYPREVTSPLKSTAEGRVRFSGQRQDGLIFSTPRRSASRSQSASSMNRKMMAPLGRKKI